MFMLAISKGSLNNIENLDLEWNMISDQGMRAFAEALSKGGLHNLIHLNLGKDTILDIGFEVDRGR